MSTVTNVVDPSAKCPYCDCNIRYDTNTGDYFDDMYYFINWIGMCPQCQRTFSFSETYRLVERRMIDEED